MVRTRGKKKNGRFKKSIEKEAENALSEKQTSDSVTMKEDGIKLAAEFEEKEGTAVDKGRNITHGKEETEKVTDVDHDGENNIETGTNGEAESEENSSDEEDEMDDLDDEMWEDDDEDSEDHVENLVDKDSVDKDEAIEETSEEEHAIEDSEEVEYSEASMEEDDEEQEHTQKDEELTKIFGKDNEAKAVGKDDEEHNVEKVKISSKKMEKSSESSGKLKKMEKLSESSGKLEIEKASESSGKIKMMGKLSEDSRNLKMEKSSERTGKKVKEQLPKKVGAGDRPESSSKRKGKKRVESMGMIFMCSATTKDECYQYKVLGLPASKKDIVEKIYAGMRLFLYDVDLKLLYGIYKAAGPGGFNIEPKAFKSQFPSQVRFTILDDCLPLAEEKFKMVIKENYYTNSKFDCQLNSQQVRNLCKLFLAKSKGKRSRKFVRQGKSKKHQPARRGPEKQRTGIKRPQVSKEDRLLHARPLKRPRKVINSAVPLHHSPRASPSPPLRYGSGRTTDAEANRRDSYLESRSHYRRPIISRREPYRDWRDAPPAELDRYRDGHDINPVSRYRDTDKRDTYIGRSNPFRDAGNTYPERRDLYRDGRDPYIDRHDTYRDVRDPYLKIRDSYRDERDSYLERRGSYMDRTYSVPYSNDRRDPLADRNIVHREVQGVDYRDSYRREELSDLRLSSETRRRHDIGSRDSYGAYLRPSSYAEPVYSYEYIPRLGAAAARVYHL